MPHSHHHHYTTSTLMHGQYGLYIFNWPTLAWRQDNPRHRHDWRLSSGSPPPLLNSGWWQPGFMVRGHGTHTLSPNIYFLGSFTMLRSLPLMSMSMTVASQLECYNMGYSDRSLCPKRYHTAPTLVWPCTCTCNRAPRHGCHTSRQEPIGHTIAFPFWWSCLQQLCLSSPSCVVKTLLAPFSQLFNCSPVRYSLTFQANSL